MKQVTITIHCDTCDKNISPHESGYPAKYILHVTTENVAIISGSVFGVIIYPPIPNDLYFCNIKCMKEYGDQK